MSIQPDAGAVFGEDPLQPRAVLVDLHTPEEALEVLDGLEGLAKSD